MFHTWARSVTAEKIIFEDVKTTHLPANGAVFLQRRAEGDWALQIDGSTIASGGIATHYHRPHVDFYMEVS